MKPTGYNHNTRRLGKNKFQTEFYTEQVNFLGLDKKWRSLEEQAFPSFSLRRLIGSPRLAYSSLAVSPDTGNPGTTTCNGYVQDSNATYSTAQSGGGTLASVTDSTSVTNAIHNSNLAGTYYVTRSFFLFDTSSLTSSATISAATFRWYVNSVGNTDSDSIRMITTTPASNTSLATGDFGNVGTVAQATADIAIGSLTLTADNTFTLNSTGIGSISKTGITKFGLRTTKDISATQPTGSNTVVLAFSGCTSPTGHKPLLTVTYTLAATNATFLLNFV